MTLQKTKKLFWALFSMNQLKYIQIQQDYLQSTSISRRSQGSKGQRGQQQQNIPPHPPTWSWSAINADWSSAAPSFYPLTPTPLHLWLIYCFASPLQRVSLYNWANANTHDFPAVVEKLTSPNKSYLLSEERDKHWKSISFWHLSLTSKHAVK